MMDGKKLRAMRLRAGLTVKDLAAKSGLTSQTIEQIESGKSTRIWDATLMQLAKGLGADPVELEVALKVDEAAVAGDPHVPKSVDGDQKPHVQGK